VETMVRIASETESAHAALSTSAIQPRPGPSFSEAVAHASVTTAADLNAKAIVVPTESGQTARTIARFRPCCPIVAATPSSVTQRQLMFVWGVHPIVAPRADNTDQVLSDAVEAVKQHGYASEGDVIVITGGAAGYGTGTTNLMKVHLIERVLARGVGVGERRVIGRVRRLSPPVSPSVHVDRDEIVVTSHADRTFEAVLRRAAGLVTVDAPEDSFSRLLAIEIGIPAVVGTGDGGEALRDGMAIVLDAEWGVIYDRPPALTHVEE
jgi:pyruvate kinase